MHPPVQSYFKHFSYISPGYIFNYQIMRDNIIVDKNRLFWLNVSYVTEFINLN